MLEMLRMYGRPEFTVGGALRQTWDIVRRQAATLAALSFVLYALPVAVVGLLPALGLTPTAESMRRAAAAGQPVPASTFGTLIAYGLASFAVLFIGSLLASAAVIWVCHEKLHGRRAGLASGTARAMRALPANLAMSILLALAVMLGFLVLVVPGIMLFLRWSVAVPALVVEKAGILGSLGRSRDLTDGHRWSILGFLLVVTIVNLVVFGGASLVIGLLGAAVGGIGGQAVSILSGLVMNAGFAALGAAATAALYFELRRAGEGTLSAETVEAFA